MWVRGLTDRRREPGLDDQGPGRVIIRNSGAEPLGLVAGAGGGAEVAGDGSVQFIVAEAGGGMGQGRRAPATVFHLMIFLMFFI